MCPSNKLIIPTSMPRCGNRFSRFVGRLILNWFGWKVVGQLPDRKKLIIIAAPHTSNWDLILALSVMFMLGLRLSWMMKREAFFWPLGGIWKRFGGIPIDRRERHDVTIHMREWFDCHDNAWLGLTPEGTRSTVSKYRKGYLHIAFATGIPILLVGLDGERKQVRLDKVWMASGDMDKDNRAIKAYFDTHYKTGFRRR